MFIARRVLPRIARSENLQSSKVCKSKTDSHSSVLVGTRTSTLHVRFALLAKFTRKALYMLGALRSGHVQWRNLLCFATRQQRKLTTHPLLAQNSIQVSNSSKLLDSVLSGQQICRDDPNRSEPWMHQEIKYGAWTEKIQETIQKFSLNDVWLCLAAFRSKNRLQYAVWTGSESETLRYYKIFRLSARQHSETAIVQLLAILFLKTQTHVKWEKCFTSEMYKHVNRAMFGSLLRNSSLYWPRPAGSPKSPASLLGSFQSQMVQRKTSNSSRLIDVSLTFCATTLVSEYRSSWPMNWVRCIFTLEQAMPHEKLQQFTDHTQITWSTVKNATAPESRWPTPWHQTRGREQRKP